MSIKNFFDGGKQISDSTGLPLSGGLCYFYDPGTTTPKNTYTTSAIAVANANPVVLDSSGRANIWLNGNYRVIVRDSSSNTIYDEDNINPETTTTVTAITSSTALNVADKGKVLEVNGSGITLTLTAASTLGAGWYVDYISTDSTNTFAFGRANAGNTINGSAANLTVYPLQAGRIYVNQAANGFYTEGDVTARGTNYWSGTTNAFSGVLIAKLSVASNLSLTASVGSSALTLALKGDDGSDPSATNIGYVPFRNVTATTGNTVWLPVNAATSLVISSGSTLGTTSGVISRTWVVCFNDGSTFRLGAINCSTATNVYPLSNDTLASSTAEGGAGAADSAGVIYTGTAVAAKAMTVLGYIESTQATAGTWATSPTKIQPWKPGMKLPGEVVQYCCTQTGAQSNSSTAIPHDDTIPQITEGFEVMTLAITPVAAMNVLKINTTAVLSNDSGAIRGLALFQDATAGALAATAGGGAANQEFVMTVTHCMLAGTTSSTTLRVRGGASSGTTTINGSASARIYGGVMSSSLNITEFMG